MTRVVSYRIAMKTRVSNGLKVQNYLIDSGTKTPDMVTNNNTLPCMTADKTICVCLNAISELIDCLLNNSYSLVG